MGGLQARGRTREDDALGRKAARRQGCEVRLPGHYCRLAKLRKGHGGLAAGPHGLGRVALVVWAPNMLSGIRHSLPRTWPRDIRSFANCGQFSLKPKHRAQVAPGPISAGLRKLDWITGVPLPVTLVKVRRSRRTQRRRVQSLPRSFCRAGMLCCRSVLEQAALTRTAVSLVLAALLLAAGVVCGAEPLSLASLMRS